MEGFDAASYVALDTLFEQSDVLSLHSSLSADNENIINGANLNKMKSGAILLNTARGGLIDEHALNEALLSRKIRAAGLDVLAQEPPSTDNPLVKNEYCLVTPHIAWASIESRKRLMKIVTDNLRNYLMGEPTNVINP